MTIAMAALTRSKSGAYTARKGIPKDVQDEYERLYGQRWEVKLSLPADTRPQDAKARFAEWLSKVEAQIAAIRDKRAGIARTLSEREARALAGEWYRDFVAQHEENPGSPTRWAGNFWALVDRLEDHHPEGIESARLENLEEWMRLPEVRAGIRADIAKEAL
jgi:hypothetical protein